MAYLNLNDNNFNKFPEVLTLLTSLEYLFPRFNFFYSKVDRNSDMSGTNLKEFPDILCSIETLRSLSFAFLDLILFLCVRDMSDNSISSLPSDIGTLTLLRNMDLQYNSITAIPTEISLCTGLNSLNLQSNLIKELPSEISYMQKLESLLGRIRCFTHLLCFNNVEYNYLTYMPTVILAMTQLTSIDFRYNYLDCTGLEENMPWYYSCDMYKCLECPEDGHPVCSPFSNYCAIQCGPNHYREEYYCKSCSDIDETTLCQECDGKGVCKRCLPGYSPVNGTCQMCGNLTYSPDGTECIHLDHCTKSEKGQSAPNCLNCSLGYRLLDSKTCEPCPGNAYGTDGQTCTSNTNCVGGVSAQYHPSCTECAAGFGLNSGKCQLCPETTYSHENKCVLIDGCKQSPTGKSSPSCELCDLGYKLEDDHTCTICDGNTFGADGKACTTIPKCVSGIPGSSVPSCLECEAGYGMENGACVKCAAGTYSTDGKTSCRNMPLNCGEYDTANSKCTACAGGYILKDDKCEACGPNQYSENNECHDITVICAEPLADGDGCAACPIGQGLTAASLCEDCPPGKFSNGKVPCTDVCAYFSDDKSVCAKMSGCAWDVLRNVCSKGSGEHFARVEMARSNTVDMFIGMLLEEHPGLTVVRKDVFEYTGYQAHTSTAITLFGEETAIAALAAAYRNCGSGGAGTVCAQVANLVVFKNN